MDDPDALADVLALPHLGCQFPLRIDGKRQLRFVLLRELLGDGTKSALLRFAVGRVRAADLRLAGEDIVAEGIAQLRRLTAEISRDDGRVEGPQVADLRERE